MKNVKQMNDIISWLFGAFQFALMAQQDTDETKRQYHLNEANEWLEKAKELNDK